MAKEYETLFIVNPELADDQIKDTVERLKGILEKNGAQLLREDHWGRRKLAFEVRKQPRGYYVNLHYVGGAHAVDELERTLRNWEQVIRYLTVGGGWIADVEGRRAELEKLARERAERVKTEAYQEPEDEVEEDRSSIAPE